MCALRGGIIMAWPFGNSAQKDQGEDASLTEDRLKIMANIAIEQVPLPEEGELGGPSHPAPRRHASTASAVYQAWQQASLQHQPHR